MKQLLVIFLLMVSVDAMAKGGGGGHGGGHSSGGHSSAHASGVHSSGSHVSESAGHTVSPVHALYGHDAETVHRAPNVTVMPHSYHTGQSDGTDEEPEPPSEMTWVDYTLIGIAALLFVGFIIAIPL